jgi:SAM-dependent methyltransferase
MKECSKSISRRLASPGFINSYFVGNGLDIGGKPDPLSLYLELFCQMKSVRTWDWEDGDAQYLSGVEDGEYDFVHSSHCLEHIVDPQEALVNWFRAVRPGGHLVITVPDEDLYEQGVFPSTFNQDHKWTFTIMKDESWSEKSINVLDIVRTLGGAAEVVKIELLSATYRYNLPRYDQTLTPVGECGIEVIIRKRHENEISTKGRLPGQPELTREMKIHLNQYRDDQKAMKQSNLSATPFTNDADI